MTVKLERRHFVFIASVIQSYQHRMDAAVHFADLLAATNKNFDRSKFIAACMEREK